MQPKIQLFSPAEKNVMEWCKKRALAAGLTLRKENGEYPTLEYIVSNRELNELDAKVMIPTLFDFWMHDVDTHRKQTIYDYYPHNAYETVINTHPPISFYNDNNASWVNAFICYHVLAHEDFFWNNIYFSETHRDDFCGKALSDKRKIARLREEMGADKRWVDYCIEFTDAIDNLFDPGNAISLNAQTMFEDTEELMFYFGPFTENLRKEGRMKDSKHYALLDTLNGFVQKYGEDEGIKFFFLESAREFPEFGEAFNAYKKEKEKIVPKSDIIQYVMENSEYINGKGGKNKWMKEVMTILKDTSAYFYPQMITKIANEGWASYWHQELFMADKEMIDGHCSEFARLDAGVTSIPRAGLNPYAIGLKLFKFIEDMGNKGKFSEEYQRMTNMRDRNFYDTKEMKGREKIFWVRKYLNDRQLINYLSEADFEDFVRKNNLFVVGTRIKPQYPRPKIEYYVKSRKGADYRRMLNGSLYHKVNILRNDDKANKKKDELYLDHTYEGRTLVTGFIHDVLLGLAHLWGEGLKPVILETTEFKLDEQFNKEQAWARVYSDEDELRYEEQVKYKKIRKKYTMLKGNMKEEIISMEEVTATVK